MRRARRMSLVLISDPGPDPDDVKAILVAAVLHRLESINLTAVVANGGGQPARRAQLARTVLDHVGVTDVPVGVGSLGTPYVAQPHEYALSGFNDKASLVDGHALLMRTLRSARNHSLTVCCISSLRDLADVITAEPALVLAKVASLVIQGGLERAEVRARGRQAGETRCWLYLPTLIRARLRPRAFLPLTLGECRTAAGSPIRA